MTLTLKLPHAREEIPSLHKRWSQRCTKAPRASRSRNVRNVDSPALHNAVARWLESAHKWLQQPENVLHATGSQGVNLRLQPAGRRLGRVMDPPSAHNVVMLMCNVILGQTDQPCLFIVIRVNTSLIARRLATHATHWYILDIHPYIEKKGPDQDSVPLHIRSCGLLGRVKVKMVGWEQIDR